MNYGPAIEFKYPTAKQMSHEENGVTVFDFWECAEHAEPPTSEELSAWDVEMKTSQEYLVSKFNADLAIGREVQVFDADELDRFSAVSYIVNELIRFKNFWGGMLPGGVTYVGLKQMGEKFVTNGKITRSDYNKLNGILKEQNIDLDNPPTV